MYRLRTLGRVELVRGSGAPVRSVLSQPKRIALLAYLATSSGEPCSRDRLIEVFWPDLDPENARHALSQALYYLRRSLGRHVIVSAEADRVQLSWDHLECDVHAFQDALDREQLQEALDRYRGDYLQDLSLPDLPAFQRWAEEHRSSLRSLARDAAILLSERAQEQGDGVAAREWARWAVDVAPLEERPLRRLLSSLCAVGDRARAMAVYDEFRARLRAELEVEPSSATRELVESIAREDPDPPGRAVSAGPLAEGLPSAGLPPADPAPSHERPGAADDGGRDGRAVAAGSGDGSSGFRRLPTFGTGLVSLSGWLVALALGLSIALLGRGDRAIPSASEAADATRVAVLPFSFQGSDHYAYLGPGIAELVTISLGELEPLRMVDLQAVLSTLDLSRPAELSVADGDRVARRFGARFYVTGSVIEIGGRLEVIAYLHRQGGELLATVREHTTDEAELFQVVDDLVRGLMALDHLPAGSALGRTAAVTTHSYPALRSFLQGEDRYRRGQYEKALEALEEAVALDPSFALAYYRGALSSLWIGSPDFDVARDWIRGAMAHKDRLPEQEQLLIRALDAFLAGKPLTAERLYRQILVAQPENVEAWFNLGEVLFHYGPVMGREPAASLQAWERVLEVQPDHRGALFHLVLIGATEGNAGELVRGIRRLEAVDPDRPPSLPVQALAAWATGDRDAQRQVLERARHEPPRSVHWAAEYLARYLHEVPGALEMARVLVERAETPEERLDAHLRTALLELSRGRVRAAEEEILVAEGVDPGAAAIHLAYMATFPEVLMELRALAAASEIHAGEDPPGVLSVRDAMPRMPRPEAPDAGGVPPPLTAGGAARGADADLRWYLAGLLSMREGGGAPGSQAPDGIARLHALSRQDDRSYPMSRFLAGGLRAEGELRAQRRTEALEALRSLLEEPEMWYEMTRVSPLYSMVRERFLLAGLLRGAGDRDGAARWYRSLVRSTLGEVPLLGPSWLRMAEIHEARREFEKADELYRRVLELWGGADPDLDLVVAEIRARLASRGDLTGGRPPPQPSNW
jgi:DNA-binding SARP family transcriptional activator/TolB-like protein